MLVEGWIAPFIKTWLLTKTRICKYLGKYNGFNKELTLNKITRYFVFFLIIGFPVANYATVIAQTTFSNLAKKSEIVFDGEVINIEVAKNTQGRIYTYITFEVIEELSNSGIDEEEITLRFTGGTYNEESLDFGIEYPKLGERGIYFVEKIEFGLINPLLGWEQGHFKITNDNFVKASNGEYVISVNADAVQTSSISSGIAAGVLTKPLQAKQAESLQNNSYITIFEFKEIIIQELSND